MAITNGYATLAEVKSRLDITGSSFDTMIEDIVTAVSRAIDEETGRRFYAVSETRYYTPDSKTALWVDDLLSVTTLKTDEDGDRTYEVTWATTDYDLWPFNAQKESQPRPYTRLLVTPDGDNLFPKDTPKGVELAGSFGFASTTPPVIKQACMSQAMLEFRAKDAPGGDTGGGEFRRAILAAGLHPFVRRMLEPYRRLGFV